jgi:hypothetical protein
LLPGLSATSELLSVFGDGVGMSQLNRAVPPFRSNPAQAPNLGTANCLRCRLPSSCWICWISRRVERVFASWRASKVPVDLPFRVVGGDGFEPPTPAL